MFCPDLQSSGGGFRRRAGPQQEPGGRPAGRAGAAHAAAARTARAARAARAQRRADQHRYRVRLHHSNIYLYWVT